jgi:hypothetical protein
MLYKCTTTSGGGTEHDAGIWTFRETPKTMTFEYTGNLIFEPNYKKIRISKTGKFYGDVLRDWEDGTYTAYPKQCGTPYYFEPIN